MSGYRTPGSLCGDSPSWSILDGTAALWWMPAPTSTCAGSPGSSACISICLPAAPDLSMLFRACRNPQVGLTDEDYAAAASVLGVDPATIKAVAEVETSGSAFDTLVFGAFHARPHS